MIKLYKRILSIGVENNVVNQQKKIMLLNSFCLCWFIFSIIFILHDFFFLSDNSFIKPTAAHSLNMLVIILIIFFQHKGYLITARIMFIIQIMFGLLFFSVFLDPGILIELILILIPLVSLIFFEKKWIAISIGVVAFLINVYSFNTITEYSNLKFEIPILLAVYTGAYLVLNYSQNLNKKQELSLEKQHDIVLADKITLEKQEVELRELNEFKSHFFVNLSHEIRTPITLIKGYSNNINLKDDETVNRQKLNIVNSQIQQIEHILNSILDLSKLDANKLILNRKAHKIIPFLNKHYADFKALFNKKEIEYTLTSNIHDVNVNMDSDLISKSINNLLSNTLKFTPKNGVVNIDILFNEDLTIKITDNGIGIPKKDLEKIFDRFYQSKNHINKSKGSGIGLSFTKSILDTHNFYITVDSIPNIKTTFSIIIPKEFISIAEYSPKTPNNQTNTTNLLGNITKTPNIKNKNAATVLVVDDHKQMRSYLANTLHEYNIIEAGNGKEALHILNTNNIDLIVTDYMMPVMSGEQLIKEIKNIGLKIPIIMLTARIDDLARLNMLRIGIDGFLTKPFIEEELKLFVENSLQLHKNAVKNQQLLTEEEKYDLEKNANSFQQKAIEYIINNISNSNFTPLDIADYFNISPRTLNRKSKSIFGQSAKLLISTVRIEKARELQLKHPDLSKKEIGFSVGIKNTSYLFKKISEKYGQHYNS